MFAVDCPTHGTRVLLDYSRIEAQRNTAEGPVVDWRCWCGARGQLVRGFHTRARPGSREGIAP